MLYYRYHGFPVAADAPLGETFALVKACLEKAALKKTPLRFCLFGTQGCQQIVARFPEFRPFLSTAGPQPHAEQIEHLSNFGPSAPGALGGPTTEAAPETLDAVVSGIPQEFSIYMVDFVLGPILEDTKVLRALHVHSPLMKMQLQCVKLGWQDSPTRDGRRYFLTFGEPLPSADKTQRSPGWLQTLYAAFPGASADPIKSELDSIVIDYGMIVSSGGRFVRTKSIGDDLKLPYQLPDSSAASHLGRAPLRSFKTTVARTFVEDGWKPLPVATPVGIYELRKRTPGGRRMCLFFWLRDHGRSAPRILSVNMQVVANRRTLTLFVHAERSARHEYEVPNSEVLSQILENTKVVVKYLEKSWIRDVEQVLSPKAT